MVNLVEDWEDMKAYSGQVKHGSYQINGIEGIVEVRVKLGNFGFIKDFKDPNDPFLGQILTFCKMRKYFNVSKTVRDDLFFR